MESIVSYCERDVVALAKVFLRLCCQELKIELNIVHEKQHCFN